MTIHPEGDPLKSAWRAQTVEITPLSIDQIQGRIRAFQARSRRALLVGAIAVAGGLFIAGLEWRAIEGLLWRSGVGLMAVGYLTVLILAYRAIQRHQGEVSGDACAAFLRQSLKRRLFEARGAWLLFAAPLAPGLAVMLTAMALRNTGPVANFAPIAVLGGVWLAAMLLIQSRSARDLRRQIAELEAATEA
jgi:hypothetical protein